MFYVRFMGDDYLEKLANSLICKSPDIFNYLISHRKPSEDSLLNNLEFCDANKFYQVLENQFILNENIYNKTPDNIKYDYEPIYYYASSYDRCLPLTVSFHDKIKHYWSLQSYFYNYLKGKNITHVLFG